MASTPTPKSSEPVYDSVAPIDEDLLNVEQAVKALEESLKDSLISVDAALKALRKSMTKKELVVTPRQFANQERAEYKEVRL